MQLRIRLFNAGIADSLLADGSGEYIDVVWMFVDAGKFTAEFRRVIGHVIEAVYSRQTAEFPPVIVARNT